MKRCEKHGVEYQYICYRCFREDKELVKVTTDFDRPTEDEVQKAREWAEKYAFAPLQLPISIEVDPALKLRIETAMSIVARYEPLIRENKVAGVLEFSDGQVANPEIEMYYNAVLTLKDYLDPEQPQGYVLHGSLPGNMPAKKEET